MISKLRKKLEKEIEENEYNLVNIKGVKLSRADLETAVTLLNILEERGTLKGFLVIGEVRDLFDKCGICY